MDNYNGLDNINGIYSGMPIPAASLAWQMFMNSGEPGMYMLYRDLSDEEKFE